MNTALMNYCRDFSKLHDAMVLHPRLTHFDFARYYEDTRRVNLFCNAKMFELIAASKVQEIGNTEFSPSAYTYGAYLAQSMPSQAHYDYLADQNNEYYGLHLILPNNGYTDFMCFAFDQSNPEYLNYYLSYMNELKKQAYLFLKSTKKLIESATRHAYERPYRLSSNPVTFCNKARDNLAIQPIIKSLSKRELECCFYLVQGHMAKTIAKALQVSHRTIHSYIESIRLKLADYIVCYPTLGLALRALLRLS